MVQHKTTSLQTRHVDANRFVLSKENHKTVPLWKHVGFAFYLVLSITIDIITLFGKRKSTQELDTCLAGKAVWVFESKNNLRSLLGVASNFRDNVFITYKNHNSFLPSNDIKRFGAEDTPISFKKIIYKFVFFVGVLVNRRFSKLYFKSICDSFWRNERTYLEISSEIDQIKPLFIVTSNDINSYTRMVLYAFREKDIPQYYIQHASVSSVFPKLVFTKSYLFGQQAKEMYCAAGEMNERAVTLVGNHLLDGFKDIADNKPMSDKGCLRIGIAFNELDELSKVANTISLIQKTNINAKVYCKPHPRDSRSLEVENVKFIYDLRQFLGEIDLLITGVSGITLDAVLANITVFQTNWFPKSGGVSRDYYGFLKHGLCEFISDKDLKVLLKDIFSNNILLKKVRNRAQYFDASIGSNWEWNVANKIATEIKADLNFYNV